jgi:hypothetical protein
MPAKCGIATCVGINADVTATFMLQLMPAKRGIAIFFTPSPLTFFHLIYTKKVLKILKTTHSGWNFGNFP